MLPLNIIFLVLISLIALIVVTSLILNIRGVSLNRILDIFYFISSTEYEFESCVTKYLENYEDLDRLCKICENIGKKLKKSCYCFVVYSNNISFGSCEVRCTNSTIWLIRYSLPDGKSIVEC